MVLRSGPAAIVPEFEVTRNRRAHWRGLAAARRATSRTAK